MRVLSVGASDAIVEGLIQREFDADGLTIDVIEPSREACKIAARRVKGNVFWGASWDDAKLSPAQYDAVVAFELIEHVADPLPLLAFLERVCKPAGRVYVSTPDGTFGNGKNPNHLRVYTASQFSDLLRRRGKLENFEVGKDGIAVGCYTPRYGEVEAVDRTIGADDVAIYAPGGWKKWSPFDMEKEGGLGGSETAAVRLASALGERGYVVTVYGEVENMMVGQVAYRHHSTFEPGDRRKATILSRVPQALDRRYEGKTLLWLHDADYPGELTEERISKVDAVMTLSKWQREHLGLGTITANGINPEYFKQTPPPWDQRTPRAIYSSSPDRGLDLVLEAWPDVRKRVEGAELVYCYSSVYDETASQRPDLKEFRDRVNKLADQPGVVNLGALSHPDLASAMAACRAWVHPSWWSPGGQPFHETYCIGAIEAQAAGCVPVMAPWGALKERNLGEARWFDDDPLLHTRQLDGRSMALPKPKRMAKIIARALQHTPVMGGEARAAALNTTWDRTAADFASVIG